MTDNTQLVAALGLQCHHFGAILLGDWRIAESHRIGAGELVVIPKLCGKLILRIAQIEKLGLALGMLAEDKLLVIHAVAQLCVELVELAFKLEVILLYRSALFVQAFQFGSGGGMIRAVLFHRLGGLSDLLLLGIDAAGEHHLFLTEGLNSLLGCSFEHSCRFNILLVFADADIELGQSLCDFVKSQQNLAALGVLFHTEICHLTDAVTERLGFVGESFDFFLVFDLRVFIFLHIGTELGKERIVGILFGAKLIELGVLGVAEDGDELATILSGVFIILGSPYLLGQLGNLCLELLDGSLALGKLCLQALDFAGSGEDSVACTHGTTRKGAACVDLLTVKGDNAHAVVQRLCHNACVLDVIKHNDSAKQRGEHLLELFFGIDQTVGNADVALKACCLGDLFCGLACLHRSEREEGRSACLSALEGVHCRLCGGFILNNNVLQVCAKCDLNGGQVLVTYRDDLGKRTVDGARGGSVCIGDLPLPILLHNVTDSIGISLKVLLHGFEGGNSLRNGIAAEGFIVQLCGAGFERRGSIGEGLLMLGDLTVDACDLCIVCGNRSLLDGTLLGKLVGDLAVALKLGQCRAIFVGIGVFGILKNRNANLDVNGFVLKVANVLESLCDICLKLARFCCQVSLFKGELFLLACEHLTARLQLCDVCGVLGASIHFVLQCLFGTAYTALCCGNKILGVGNGVLGYAIFTLKLVAELGLLTNLCQELLRLFLAALRCLEQLCILRLQGLDGILCHLQIKGRVLHCLLGGSKLVVQLFGVVQPQADVGALFVLHQLNCLFGLFGFLLQRSYLRRYLKKDIVCARHIVLGRLELTLCLVLFVAVFCNTRSILKHAAAFLALTGYHLGDTSLTDDGVTVTANARIHKELVDILQTNTLAVDEVFTVARAIVTAGDRNLIVGAIQFCKFSAVIEGDRYLGVSHGATAVGTAKDNVLHFATAQALGRDFAKYPTHSVGNVRFTRAVRAYDDRNAVVLSNVFRQQVNLGLGFKHELGLIGERFEALHFQ